MELSKTDKRKFEYINHLHFDKQPPYVLTWDEYQKRPNSDWLFPKQLEIYFEKVFADNKDIIESKTILDIGCEYGSKIPWFDKFNPEKITCIDPSEYNITLANHVANISDQKCRVSCECISAEEYNLEADTIFMLSVNQFFENQQMIYSKLKCENLVIDTWLDRNISYNELLTCFKDNYSLEKEWYYNEKRNRVILRFKNE